MRHLTLDIVARAENAKKDVPFSRYEDELTEIINLVQKGEYKVMVPRAEALLSEGIYDIRIIAYVMYGCCLREGPQKLGAVLNCLNELLLKKWNLLLPESGKSELAEKCLNWFFNQVNRKFTHEERKKQIWKTWVRTISEETMDEALAVIPEFWQAMELVLKKQQGGPFSSLATLRKWVSDFKDTIIQENGITMDETKKTPENTENQPPEPAKRKLPATPPANHEQLLQLEDSHDLKMLLKKLSTFEQLISGQDMKKAAIVADDIQFALENFDPKIYFPKLFAKFSSLMVMHVGDLASFDMEKDTREWHSLQEYYKVDMDGFLNLEI